MFEISDIFLGRTVDAGPEPTYEEKMKVPHPPWPFGVLLCTLGTLANSEGSDEMLLSQMYCIKQNGRIN